MKLWTFISLKNKAQFAINHRNLLLIELLIDVLVGYDNYFIVSTRFCIVFFFSKNMRLKITRQYYLQRILLKKEYKILKCVPVNYKCVWKKKILKNIYMYFVSYPEFNRSKYKSTCDGTANNLCLFATT